MDIALQITDILFKFCVCVFMVVTISRERDHYRFLKDLQKDLDERQKK